jgi:hypothetical protein
VAVGLVGALLLAALAWFDPSRYPFYPRCYFKALTGLSCPGCGGLRAAHQFLHGNIRAAFELNPLFFVIMPFLGWFALAEVVHRTSGRKLSHPFKHRAWLWALLALVVGFGIVRNLPVGPFASSGP